MFTEQRIQKWGPKFFKSTRKLETKAIATEHNKNQDKKVKWGAAIIQDFM